MLMFKCKMCGGTLSIQPGMTVAECEYCGTKQTLPRLDDDKKKNLYDRANHFRRNNEFDKAMAIYEQILNEDTTDAEAYWSLVLGRYGIEYVEDPATHRRVPTVNRAQYTSVFADENYKAALKYADGYQRSVYEAEARAIDEIQRGILTISQQEEPFDVFICYKENDQLGHRTPDSVLANDLYHQLTEEGLKVFFARITLENKLGSAYEPYIFAALNSAKVMVVLGTKREYFNAVWVKNEWSRFLSLIQGGADKILIPAYKDMDPYDLPEEFSHLQAQNMSQLGFLQDLIRGIKKILDVDKKEQQPEAVSSNSGATAITPLLKRVFLFLEDRDWASADEYCEKVLDMDPENGQAYLGKLMAELHVSHQEDLANCDKSFKNCNHYQKILRFADPQLKETVEGYLSQILERKENARRKKIYQKANDREKQASKESEYREIAQMFQDISGYADADTRAQQCLAKAEQAYKEERYQEGCEIMEEYHAYITKNGYSCYDQQPLMMIEDAIKIFIEIPDWKDVSEKKLYCENEIEEIKRKQEEDRAERERWKRMRELAAQKQKRNRKIRRIVLTALVVAALAGTIFYYKVAVPEEKYQQAMKAMEEEDYWEACWLLEEIKDYKDSAEKFKIADQKEEARMNVERYKMILSAKIGDSVSFGRYEQDNNLDNGKEGIEWRVLDKKKDKVLLISQYCLDKQPYHTKDKAVEWKKSSIRKWLNETFFKEAFSEEQQNKILSVKVQNPRDRKFGTKKEESTRDQIFLLSVKEAEKYFDQPKDRMTDGTIYLDINYVGDDTIDQWLLRTVRKNKKQAACVFENGNIDYSGVLTTESYGIRPALWVDLEKLK